MSRLSFAAVALALILPVTALADSKRKPDPRPAVIPAIAYGEAKPASYTAPAPVPVAVSSCPNGDCGRGGGRFGGGSFGGRLGFALIDDNHECAPDGCPKPIGCGNFWTEKKFIFGSCRQFFGTAGATVGVHRAAVEQP
jgi:hypothetical protein